MNIDLLVMKRISPVILCLLFIFQGIQPILAQSGRIPVRAENGMVVSSHYLASEIGTEILKKGGNAVDASVATAFALAVTLPSAGNIGGGGFLLYHGDDGHQTSFNFREKAPLAASRDMFLDENGKIKDNSNHEGPLSVGVPGTVAGLYMAHQKMGKLPWKDLLQPAINLAENGIPTTYRNHSFLTWVEENKNEPLYQATAAAFLKNGTEIFKPGETWKQPDLAESLKRIRDKGADGFYKGKTAQLFADFMQKHGGLITLEDLAKYEAEELKPVKSTYRDYDIVAMPPPSSGGVTLINMLNIVEAYNLEDLGHNSAASLHILTEAMRRAYANRAQHLGDPNFNPKMPLDEIMSKDHAAALRENINMNKASKSDSSKFVNAHLKYESPETTHISVVDKEGNAVSLTYTLEHSYGSKITVEGAGFLLNNEMGDFNPIPGRTDSRGLVGTDPNLVAPEKRMLSSMTPTIVAKDGKPLLVIGSPGGRTIINTVFQVILNVLDYNMNVARAVEAPRIHHQWLPDFTRFERYGISPDTRKLYEEKGHTVRLYENQGQAMGIYLDHEQGLLFGAADTRSYDSRAVGF